MKKNILSLVILFLWMGICAGQDREKDRVSMPFSDPSKPGLVKVGLINGGITVQAYQGKEVVVESVSRGRKYSRPRKENEKARGLKRLRSATAGLIVEEEDNVMTVSTSSLKRTVNLAIQVPAATSLQLSTINNGEIEVTGVNGEIEVSNTNGGVSLSNCAGAAVAHALNGDVNATLAKVRKGKDMSFSSLNGDIDVTLPSDIRATLKMKTQNGEIYSDFDIRLRQKTERSEEGGRRRKVRVESTIYGDVNGGGAEIVLSTFNGDVFIRKGK